MKKIVFIAFILIYAMSLYGKIDNQNKKLNIEKYSNQIEKQIEEVNLSSHPVVIVFSKLTEDFSESFESIGYSLIPSAFYYRGDILPGQGFEQSMLAIEGVKLVHAMEITKALREYVDFRFLVAGEPFDIKIDKNGQVEYFAYKPNIVTKHILKRNKETDQLDYKLEKLPVKTVHRLVEGNLETTLDAALIELGLPSYLKQAVNGILECSISFVYDARKGDKFKILLEEYFYNGERVPGGKILYVSYEGVRTGFHEAYRYTDDEESSAYTAHYTPKGKALIHSSLMYPLDNIHVISNFGYRIHPVTGKKAFHRGVDYRARTGTPVYSVASGVIKRAHTTKYGGRQVEIKHADGTETYYLHLSRILVKRGQKVKPRQLIGKAGSTGRVTGPHLHFGIKYRGKWLNPLKKHMIATPQLKGERLEKFKEQMDNIDKLFKNTALEKSLGAEFVALVYLITLRI